MTPYRLPRSCIVAGVCVLTFAGLSSPAVAQFPPPPGQQQQQGQNVFPPPPGQAPAKQDPAFPPPPGQAPARQDSAFPPAPGPGGSPGGFAMPSSGGAFARPAAGGFSGGAAPQPTEAQRVCLTFPNLREDVEKGAAAIRAASERKATAQEVCPLFKSFAGKEAKMVKFLETNRVLCGVPSNIIGQLQKNHANTIRIRNNVCNGGAVAAQGPSLSDVLGGPTIADDSSAKQGRGTFDTLTGNALSR